MIKKQCFQCHGKGTKLSFKKLAQAIKVAVSSNVPLVTQITQADKALDRAKKDYPCKLCKSTGVLSYQ